MWRPLRGGFRTPRKSKRNPVQPAMKLMEFGSISASLVAVEPIGRFTIAASTTIPAKVASCHIENHCTNWWETCQNACHGGHESRQRLAGVVRISDEVVTRPSGRGHPRGLGVGPLRCLNIGGGVFGRGLLGAERVGRRQTEHRTIALRGLWREGYRRRR